MKIMKIDKIMKLHLFFRAQKDAEKAIDLDSSNPEGYFLKGQVLVGQKVTEIFI